MAGDVDAQVRALGLVLGQTRARLGLEREQVSELLTQRTGDRLEPRTITAYERGTRELISRRLFQLAVVYEVPASILVAEAIRQAGLPVCCPQCGRA